MFGGAIGEIDLEADIITDPLIPHSTYDAQMAGKYLGALERDVPQSQLFQDLYKEREGKMVRGKLESEANKSTAIRTTSTGTRNNTGNRRYNFSVDRRDEKTWLSRGWKSFG